MNWKCHIKHDWHQVGNGMVTYNTVFYIKGYEINKVCLRCGKKSHAADLALKKDTEWRQKREDRNQLALSLWRCG